MSGGILIIWEKKSLRETAQSNPKQPGSEHKGTLVNSVCCDKMQHVNLQAKTHKR